MLSCLILITASTYLKLIKDYLKNQTIIPGVIGSRPRSCLVRQSTEAAMVSHLQSVPANIPLEIGFEAVIASMIGHKGAN